MFVSRWWQSSPPTSDIILIFLENQVNPWSWSKSHILYLLMVHTCSHWHDGSHLTKLKDASSRRCWDSFAPFTGVRANKSWPVEVDLPTWLSAEIPSLHGFWYLHNKLTWGINPKPNTCLTNWGNWGPNQFGMTYMTTISTIHKNGTILDTFCLWFKESKM